VRIGHVAHVDEGPIERHHDRILARQQIDEDLVRGIDRARMRWSNYRRDL
jgi:hypothetical protein